jgi:hypothetical protein
MIPTPDFESDCHQRPKILMLSNIGRAFDAERDELIRANLTVNAFDTRVPTPTDVKKANAEFSSGDELAEHT